MELTNDFKLIAEKFIKFDNSCKKISNLIPFVIINKTEYYLNKDFKSNSADILLLELFD